MVILSALGRVAGIHMADAIAPLLRERGHPAQLSTELTARTALLCSIASQHADQKHAQVLLATARTWCLSQTLGESVAQAIDLIARNTALAKTVCLFFSRVLANDLSRYLGWQTLWQRFTSLLRRSLALSILSATCCTRMARIVLS